jgi:peptidoglycan/xylan/chitin deacetylase (PgdA/CDA1 family)
MMNIWRRNTPRNFWQCCPDRPEEKWREAYRKAIPSLGLSNQADDIDTYIELTLGEAQFGLDHWQLSHIRRLYYLVKQFLPRTLIDILKKVNQYFAKDDFSLGWPIEKRYAQFQWQVMKHLLIITGQSQLSFRHFWPEGNRFSFVLTHDIETEEGQKNVRLVANLEEELGYRSSFNFVPERYPLDYQLMDELQDRGFEIGVHGLKHDGKLFRSQEEFLEKAKRINHYLKEFNASGFRSPLMLRNPEWMQALDIEYDLSFFDTDPYEPIQGGVMSIWPFSIGKFIELPYTLVQDSTLYTVLGERTSRLWLEKLDYIEECYGMALVNTHPDYLKDKKLMEIYADFLYAVKGRDNFWHTLPRQVAWWWRKRAESPSCTETPDIVLGTVFLEHDSITIN